MKTTLKNKDNLKNGGDPKSEDDLRNEDMTSKVKMTYIMKTTSKISPPLPKVFCPPLLPLKDYLKFLLMTTHHDSHTTTDVEPEMIAGL